MNPLMQMMGPVNKMQKMMQTVSNLRRMMTGHDPNAMMQAMAQQNPQFAKFLRDNQGKSPEQIAADYGLDWSMVQSMLK